MIFGDFMRQSQRLQYQYIREERVRYNNLLVALERYEKAAAALKLYPLTRSEIQDRHKQLRAMDKQIEITHGDTPGMRAAYAMQFGSTQPLVP